MEISLMVHPNDQAAFSLSLDPETFAAQYIADRVMITVQTQIRSIPRYWNQHRGLFPEIFLLQGSLYNSSFFMGIGASLHASESLPLTFSHEYGQLLNLAFHCSRAYLQSVEEQRPVGSTITLGMALWGMLNLAASQQGDETVPLQSAYLGKNIPFKSQPRETVRISQSHWLDMLANIQYPQRRYIELPVLAAQEWDEEFRGAIEHLNQAHALFASGKYREAVQRCRQSKEALLGEDKVNWSTRTLAPKIGTEKAQMINESIKALNHLGNASSHGDGIEIDRDVANYVISALTLIFNYIGQKSR